jgi:peptide/nickel transport system ATP-binding protein
MTTPSASFLEVKNLRISATGRDGSSPIVSSFSLRVAPGETVGIVGESGSGKSMTARAIMGLLPPSVTAEGEVLMGGRNILDLSERELRQVRGREIGLVLQDPFMMLNPVFRCGRIVEESLVRESGGQKPKRSERRAEVLRRLAEVGLTDSTVADRYPFQLSGGMRQRVGIAAALARDPKVLIADEPTTALDVTTQKEMLGVLRSVQRSRGMSVVLITHDLRVAFAMCDRVYVMYGGSLVEVAPAADLEARPLHPYTQGLLLSEPSLDHRVVELASIPGSVPKAADVKDRCAFEPRCRWAARACRESPPPLQEVEVGRLTACIRIPDIAREMSAERSSVDVVDIPPAADLPATGIIEVHNLRKVFSTAREVTALDDVSLVSRGLGRRPWREHS